MSKIKLTMKIKNKNYVKIFIMSLPDFTEVYYESSKVYSVLYLSFKIQS